MSTLVPIDGSQSSLEAVKYAARSRPDGELLLLYVAPSGRQGDLSRGSFVLEDGRRAAESIARDIRVHTRLEIGDRHTKLPAIAAQEGCDLVVMGAHGVNALPHVDRVSRDAAELSEELRRPVVLVLPTGQGIHCREQPAEDEQLVAGSAA